MTIDYASSCNARACSSSHPAGVHDRIGGRSLTKHESEPPQVRLLGSHYTLVTMPLPTPLVRCGSLERGQVIIVLESSSAEAYKIEE